MNNQEIFDRTWKAFVTDGAPQAINERGQCLYNAPCGGCAIGRFIPSHLYHKGMEGIRGRTLFEENEKLKQFLELNDAAVNFLIELQQIHDSYTLSEYPTVTFTSYMKTELTSLAKHYQLNVSKFEKKEVEEEVELMEKEVLLNMNENTM